MPKFREVLPKPQSIYPAKESTKEALEYARILLPEAEHNVFMQAFMTYHNTLLKQINQSPV